MRNFDVMGWLRAVSCIGLGACRVFDASLVEPPGDAAVVVDDGDTGADVVTPVPDGSVHPSCSAGSRLLPPPPNMPDEEGPEMVFGMKDVRLNQMGEAWKEIGLNLDGVCSVAPAPLVECVPPAADAEPQVDGTMGIDNAFGAELFPLIDLVFPALDVDSVEAAEIGIGVVVFRLRGYNGEANDPRVDVTISQSVAGAAGSADQTEPPDVAFDAFQAVDPTSREPLAAPLWDGNDWMWLRNESFATMDLERPLVRDDAAYVVDNQLIVNLPENVEIIFAGTGSGVNVRLTDGTAIGTFNEDRTRINPMVIAGRWSVLALLDTAMSVGVCMGDTEFTILVNQLDAIADVRSRPGTGGATVECDAISVGVTFEGFPVRIGGITEAQPLPNGCAMM